MKTTSASLLSLLLLPGMLVAAEPKPIFDGKTLDGWQSRDAATPPAGWTVTDGMLHRKAKGGDLYLARELGDFELRFEFKVSSGGNSGIKYRLAPFGKELLGPEYQILDDERHPDSLRGTSHRTAALYDIKSAATEKAYKPAGEWNTGRIVSRGTKLEHWLNEVKVLEMDTSSPEWRELKGKSKFKAREGYGENIRGRLLLQDHGDEVWFRNMMLTEEP